MNGFSAADMSTAAANEHRDGYQAGYAAAMKAYETGKPAAAQEAVYEVGYVTPMNFGGFCAQIFTPTKIERGTKLYAAPVAAAPVDLASSNREWLEERDNLMKLCMSRGDQIDRPREQLKVTNIPAAPGIDLTPLRWLVEGCEAEFICAETEELEPDDSKISSPEERCRITFGMIRNPCAFRSLGS